MLLNKVIRVRDRDREGGRKQSLPEHRRRHSDLESVSEVKASSSGINIRVPVPALVMEELADPAVDIVELDDRFRFSASPSPSPFLSSVAGNKGFSDTDSGISNTGSSTSCESFQSDQSSASPCYGHHHNHFHHHLHPHLPDPVKDVVYNEEDSHTLIPGTDGILDFDDDDDFTFKLNLSLANLGIGPFGDSMLDNSDSTITPSTTTGSNPTSARFGNHFDFNFNLDELGVDFDIVEPPPAFANCGSEELEKSQLVVDSEADEEEVSHNDQVTICPVKNDKEEMQQEGKGFGMPVEKVHYHLQHNVDRESKGLTTEIGFSSPGSSCSSNDSEPCTKTGRSSGASTATIGSTSSSCGVDDAGGNVNAKTISNGNAKRTNVTSGSNHKPKLGKHGKGNSSGEAASASSSAPGKKRKRERYEIRIGYPCYELPISSDKHVSIYSLQKNKDMMEDLLGHSKLKNSKSLKH